MGFWMQRDRPGNASREPTTTSDASLKIEMEENEIWQQSQRSEQKVAALKCNRKITGRLKSLSK
jgi:hypothetical protein